MNLRLGKNFKNRPKWISTLMKKHQTRCANFSISIRMAEMLLTTCNQKCLSRSKWDWNSGRSTFTRSSTRSLILWTLSRPAAQCIASTMLSVSCQLSMSASEFADLASRIVTSSLTTCRSRQKKTLKSAQCRPKTRRTWLTQLFTGCPAMRS